MENGHVTVSRSTYDILKLSQHCNTTRLTLRKLQEIRINMSTIRHGKIYSFSTNILTEITVEDVGQVTKLDGLH